MTNTNTATTAFLSNISQQDKYKKLPISIFGYLDRLFALKTESKELNPIQFAFSAMKVEAPSELSSEMQQSLINDVYHFKLQASERREDPRKSGRRDIPVFPKEISEDFKFEIANLKTIDQKEYTVYQLGPNSGSQSLSERHELYDQYFDAIIKNNRELEDAYLFVEYQVLKHSQINLSHLYRSTLKLPNPNQRDALIDYFNQSILNRSSNSLLKDIATGDPRANKIISELLPYVIAGIFIKAGMTSDKYDGKTPPLIKGTHYSREFEDVKPEESTYVLERETKPKESISILEREVKPKARTLHLEDLEKLDSDFPLPVAPAGSTPITQQECIKYVYGPNCYEDSLTARMSSFADYRAKVTGSIENLEALYDELEIRVLNNKAISCIKLNQTKGRFLPDFQQSFALIRAFNEVILDRNSNQFILESSDEERNKKVKELLPYVVAGLLLKAGLTVDHYDGKSVPHLRLTQFTYKHHHIIPNERNFELRYDKTNAIVDDAVKAAALLKPVEKPVEAASNSESPDQEGGRLFPVANQETIKSGPCKIIKIGPNSSRQNIKKREQAYVDYRKKICEAFPSFINYYRDSEAVILRDPLVRAPALINHKHFLPTQRQSISLINVFNEIVRNRNNNRFYENLKTEDIDKNAELKEFLPYLAAGLLLKAGMTADEYDGVNPPKIGLTKFSKTYTGQNPKFFDGEIDLERKAMPSPVSKRSVPANPSELPNTVVVKTPGKVEAQTVKKVVEALKEANASTAVELLPASKEINFDDTKTKIKRVSDEAGFISLLSRRNQEYALQIMKRLNAEQKSSFNNLDALLCKLLGCQDLVLTENPFFKLPEPALRNAIVDKLNISIKDPAKLAGELGFNGDIEEAKLLLAYVLAGIAIRTGIIKEFDGQKQPNLAMKRTRTKAEMHPDYASPVLAYSKDPALPLVELSLTRAPASNRVYLGQNHMNQRDKSAAARRGRKFNRRDFAGKRKNQGPADHANPARQLTAKVSEKLLSVIKGEKKVNPQHHDNFQKQLIRSIRYDALRDGNYSHHSKLAKALAERLLTNNDYFYEDAQDLLDTEVLDFLSELREYVYDFIKDYELKYFAKEDREETIPVLTLQTKAYADCLYKKLRVDSEAVSDQQLKALGRAILLLSVFKQKSDLDPSDLNSINQFFRTITTNYEANEESINVVSA